MSRIDALLTALPGLGVRVEKDDSFSLVRGGAVIVGNSGPLTFATLEGVASALTRLVEAKRDVAKASGDELFPAFRAGTLDDAGAVAFNDAYEAYAACKRALEESEAGHG